MRTIKPQNVMYQSTQTQGCNHNQYKTIQWHDCWCPHASQWPKPAYHHWGARSPTPKLGGGGLRGGWIPPHLRGSGGDAQPPRGSRYAIKGISIGIANTK